jgi:[amino group carrier protein]-lysine/ornithine hydrolase
MPDVASETAARPRTRIDVVDLLTAMLAVPSVSGDEDALAAMLVWRLLDAGFDVDVDAAGNVIGAWGDGPETIALVGHLDTVAGHINVRRDGDILHGRGAVDAKGPLATAIAAVSRQPRDGGRRFIVVGAVEEETTSRGAHHLATSMAAPHGLVVLEPSGWDAVTIGYKGSVRLRASIAQPQAHSAGREPSAADRCIDVVRALQDRARASNGDAGGLDRVDIRVLRFDSEGDGLVDRATVDVGIRTPPDCDAGALLDLARSAAGSGEVTVLSQTPGVRTRRDSPLARGVIGAIRAVGGAPRFKLKTGTSDLNVLVPAWGCPAVAYGPGDSGLDHTPEERVSIAELERAVDVLALALGDR